MLFIENILPEQATNLVKKDGIYTQADFIPTDELILPHKTKLDDQIVVHGGIWSDFFGIKRPRDHLPISSVIGSYIVDHSGLKQLDNPNAHSYIAYFINNNRFILEVLVNDITNNGIRNVSERVVTKGHSSRVIWQQYKDSPVFYPALYYMVDPSYKFDLNGRFFPLSGSAAA